MTSDYFSVPTPGTDLRWEEDILGPDFQAATMPLGDDPDRETDIFATLIRYLPYSSADEAAADGFFSRPALLFVHGMSDYFFQVHVAERFHAEGYAVYALDLRKCGRSHRPGQVRHHITDLSLYDVELNASLDAISEAGHHGIVPVGHSTGGLLVVLWLDRLRTTDPERHAKVTAAMLNSPWLELPFKGISLAINKFAIPLIARVAPDTWTPPTSLGGYGLSIHKDEHGEWDFDLNFKPLSGVEKKFSWVNAVIEGQKKVHGGIDTGVPTLSMYSDASSVSQPYGPETDSSDAVLYADAIAKYSARLGSTVVQREIPSARHDVYLSVKPVRDSAFDISVDFLGQYVN